jgi:glycosyltransferase involved in cell wall biosynthesis
MKLSVIVATRNRAHAIAGCFDSVAASVAHAGGLDAEIVVVDNGSTDGTAAVVAAWASGGSLPVQILHEPKPGATRSRNRGVRHARGDLLVFIDDDCRLDREHVRQVLAYDAADTGCVLRGGHVVLGDPTDLPLSVTDAVFRRWRRTDSPPNGENMGAFLLGCNMATRRAVMERVGPFDVNFGPGTRIASGEDHEYVFRAYCAGVTVERVPDMVVVHCHGRKTRGEGSALMRTYMTGSGAIYAKYLFRNPGLCRQVYWDCKMAAREIATGTNLFHPDLGFSARDKLACYVRGAARYIRHGRSEAPA